MASASPFAGRNVLIVEDEPMIGLDLANTFEARGATPVLARNVADALHKIAQQRPAAAVLDYCLVDGDCSTLGTRLRELGIPFVIYTGFSDCRVLPRTVVIDKPARAETVYAALERLL